MIGQLFRNILTAEIAENAEGYFFRFAPEAAHQADRADQFFLIERQG